MLLFLLLFLPGFLAEIKMSPDPYEVPKAFVDLYQKCQLQQYLPENAIGAKIWSLELEASGIYAVEYRVAFDGGIQVISKKFVKGKGRMQGIWSYDLRKVGLATRKDGAYHFFWDDDPSRMIRIAQEMCVLGFARKDFVYAVIPAAPSGYELVRWRTDLTGSIEILGKAADCGQFQIIEPDGPVYWLHGKKCNEFSTLLRIDRLHKCDRNKGMFIRSKFETFYGLSLFSFLTKDCPSQSYSKDWTHCFARIQFIPPPTSEPEDGSFTQGESVFSTRITSVKTTAIPEPTEDSSMTSSDDSIIYMIIGLIFGVLCFLFIVCVAIALFYRRNKQQKNEKGHEKHKNRVTSAESFAQTSDENTGSTYATGNSKSSQKAKKGKTNKDHSVPIDKTESINRNKTDGSQLFY